jgi:hypothetical protein
MKSKSITAMLVHATQPSPSRDHETEQKSDRERWEGRLARQARQLVKQTTGSATRLDCPGDALRCHLNGFCRVVNSFCGLVQHGWRITFGGHPGLPRLPTTNPVRNRLFLWPQKCRPKSRRRIAAGDIVSAADV